MKTLRINPALIVRGTLAIVVLGIATLMGLAAFLVTRELVLSRPGATTNGPEISETTGTQVLDAQGTPIPGDLPPNPNSPVSVPQLTPWDGAGRVTILVLGLDYRDWSAGEKYSRSDTMILLTLDPLTKSAGILSIPRDMWVAIPGFKHGKINTAYYLGDAYKLPGGGPGLAVKTVEKFLGVPINYYAQIDFGAFVKFIDTIGGIKINVPERITVDLLGAGPKTKKTLEAGIQVLPGEWALAYARARHTQEGDFDRARRQQQVILGIRDRVLSLNMLPTLITKAPTLYQQLAAGVHTNLSLDDAIRLALLAQQVPEANIQRGVFGKESTIFGWSPDKLSIVIPIPDKIHLLRDQIFATSGSLSPQTPGNPQEQMQAEAATVALYNGSRAPDLGNRTADWLRGQGVNLTAAEAGERYTSTTIVDHTGNPFTVKYLVELLQIAPGKIRLQYDPGSKVGVEVFLGDDWIEHFK